MSCNLMLCKVNDNGPATILPHPVKTQALKTGFQEQDAGYKGEGCIMKFTG